jgi:hypothetical protein
VIGQFWLGHLRDGFGIPEGNYGGIGSPEYFAALDRLGKYIKELRALNKEVYLVLSIPGARELDPKYLVKRDLKMFPKIFSVRTNGVKGDDIEKDYGRLHTDLAEVAVTAGAIVINPMSALCFPDCLGVDAEGEPMYKDLGHLRPFYVRRWANFIDVTVRSGQSHLPQWSEAKQ